MSTPEGSISPRAESIRTELTKFVPAGANLAIIFLKPGAGDRGKVTTDLLNELNARQFPVVDQGDFQFTLEAADLFYSHLTHRFWLHTMNRVLSSSPAPYFVIAPSQAKPADEFYPEVRSIVRKIREQYAVKEKNGKIIKRQAMNVIHGSEKREDVMKKELPLILALSKGNPKESISRIKAFLLKSTSLDALSK